MKIFAIIFGIYFLGLTTMPCTDAFHDCQNKTNNSFITGQTNKHQPGSSDNCSPFCLCSCCNATTTFKITDNKILLTVLPFLPKSITPVKDVNFVSEFYGNIWQPPKIS